MSYFDRSFKLNSTSRRLPSTSAFSPIELFAASEQGIWLDPSDLTTMFQDAAGTVPVTAVGQPVRRINDKSGNGNNATAPSDAARPILRQLAGGQYYLQFDGVDDGLSTPALDFTATDKLSVFMGVRKLSDAGGGQAIAELSPSWTASLGTFAVFAAISGPNYGFRARSSANGSANATTYTAPVTNVISCVYDFTGVTGPDQIKPRIDGVIPTISSVASTGTANNFGNHVLYISARGGSSLFFNGHLYSFIVRGAASDADELGAAESYVAEQTGVTL